MIPKTKATVVFQVKFWIKIVFLFKKNYKISFKLKLLYKIIRLDHIGDSMVNTIILNSDFIIFFNSIDSNFIIFLNSIDSDFTIF